MRKDYKVNDEFYRIRRGKTLSYYKVKILEITEVSLGGTVTRNFKTKVPHLYYIIQKKGTNTDYTYKVAAKNILLYKTLFFDDKHSMLVYLKEKRENGAKLSSQVEDEIEASTKYHTERWM